MKQYALSKLVQIKLIAQLIAIAMGTRAMLMCGTSVGLTVGLGCVAMGTVLEQHFDSTPINQICGKSL